MGLLDKAGGFTGRFKGAGEETVRVVDYDSAPEKRGKEKPEPKAKAEKAPRKRLSELLPKKGSREPSEAEFDDLPDSVEDDEDLPLAYKVATDTAFDIEDEDDNFFLGAQDDEEPEFEDLPQPQERKRSSKDGVEYDENKIKDVLEVLDIPSTYVIPGDVLMPEDFRQVEFDLQIPQGYDIGQVEFFVERAESSVKEYLFLLENRNDHIAKLATTIDRLQVDLENLKFDSQIAAGIGIMPTSDNDELERDNLELRLQVKRLEDKLKSKTTMPDLSSKERQLYEDLRNQYSIVEREKSALEQENSDLRMEIARMEEDQEDIGWQNRPSEPSTFSLDDEDESSAIDYVDERPSHMESVARTQELPGVLPDFSLPMLSEEEETAGLPDFSLDDSPIATTPRQNSSFELDDVSSTIPEPSPEDNDDEDDELAKLMKGWS